VYERVKSGAVPDEHIQDAGYVFKHINAKITRKREEMKINVDKLT
jgi:hypothetical protein